MATFAPRQPRDGSPFSNSTEGDAWTGRWCDTCIHDKGARTGSDSSGCPLLGFAYCGQTPAEWRERKAGGLVGRYDCSRYEADPDEVPAGSRPLPAAEAPEPAKPGRAARLGDFAIVDLFSMPAPRGRDR